MPSLGRLFWLNTICFGCYGIIHFFEASFESSLWLEIPKGTIFLFIAFLLFGINSALILEKTFKQNFDTLERISIALVIAFIFPALLLTIEHSSGFLFPELPLFNTAILFLIAVWLHPLALDNQFSIKTTLQSRVFQSGLLAFVLYALLSSIIISSYPALPDSDPYYWLLKIQSEIESNQLASLQFYRPLFSSFVYILHVTGGLDLYTLFKYIFPFFLSLVVIPATLIARLFLSRTQQLVVFFLPLSSASFILYSEMPIPQCILNIVLVFFIFFILHSYFSKKYFFYFLAGISMIPIYFYHEAAILIFLVWLTITIFWHRNDLKSHISQNPTLWLIALAVFISNIEHLSPIFGFVKNWLVRTVQAITVWHTNFSFPLSYVNVDGRSVGWGNNFGVLKYYAFYTGPTVLVSIFLILLYLKQKKRSLEEWRYQKEIIVLGASFCLFFILSEILPRFLSVAFLPERSWGFAGLFLAALSIIILKLVPPQKSSFITIILLGAILINVMAAVYINFLKRHLLNPDMIPSTHWISTELKKDDVIFTEKNSSLLKVFTPLQIIDAQNNHFYHDINIFRETFAQFSQQHCPSQKDTTAQTSLSVLNESVSKLINENVPLQQETLDILIKLSSQLKKDSFAPSNTPCYSSRNIYVYYSKENPKNPYSDRPYTAAPNSQLDSSALVFDLYPETFHRIYTTGENEVVIWRMVQ